MKKTIATASLMMGVSTFAMAQTVSEQVISQLRGEGFTYFEVKNGPTQVKIEAIRGNEEVEVIYDLATGALLKQEMGRAGADEQGLSGIETDQEDEDFVAASGAVFDGDGDGDGDDDDDDEDEDEDDYESELEEWEEELEEREAELYDDDDDEEDDEDDDDEEDDDDDDEEDDEDEDDEDEEDD